MRRSQWLGGLLVMVLLVGIGWFAFHERIRFASWRWVASRPLSEVQQEHLAVCDSLDWWGWVRVLTSDPSQPCDEAWMVSSISARLGPGDRRRWLLGQLDGGLSPLGRWRATRALEVVGEPVPVTSLSLLLEGTLAEPDLRRILLEGGLSPRVSILAASAELVDGADFDLGRRARLRSAYAFLGLQADVPEAIAMWSGVDTTMASASKGPPHEVPKAWAGAVSSLGRCPSDCGDEWLVLADAVLRAPDGEAVMDLPADGVGAVGLFDPILRLEEVEAFDRDAVAHLLDAEAAWVVKTPERVWDGMRGGGRAGGVLEAIWFGRMGPWVQALWLAELTRRGDSGMVLFRGSRGLWVQWGDQTRALCGVAGPDGHRVPEAEIVARALLTLHPDRVDVAAAIGGWQSEPHALFAWKDGEPPPDPCAATGG